MVNSHALYQLSYGPKSDRWDSNPRPSRWQRDALPLGNDRKCTKEDSDLRPTAYQAAALPLSYPCKERSTGIEPVRNRVEACCLTAWRTTQLPRPGSNRRHPLCRRGALPIELRGINSRYSASFFFLSRPSHGPRSPSDSPDIDITLCCTWSTFRVGALRRVASSSCAYDTHSKVPDTYSIQPRGELNSTTIFDEKPLLMVRCDQPHTDPASHMPRKVRERPAIPSSWLSRRHADRSANTPAELR